MDPKRIEKVLEDLKKGLIEVPEAMKQLKDLPCEDMGFACIDNHRALRTGYPEVVFCQGKTPAQTASIMETLSRKNPLITATRATRETFDAVKAVLPDAVYHPDARIIIHGPMPTPSAKGYVAVLTGGTSDLPVAEEAAITAETMGCTVKRLYDVGVAGIHRFFNHMDMIGNASVVIVAAGMEGALASIVGGMVKAPVIALPTGIGYGASFGGLAALLSMLNSCAPGVAVVNIDNGFGAGYMAAIINKMQGESS